MNPSSAPLYPRNLSWRPAGIRLFILTQVLVMAGAVSMHALEDLYPTGTLRLGLAYHLLWMQCVGLVSFVVNGGAMLLVMRRGWRRMPRAAEEHARLGLFGALPAAAKWQVLATTLTGLLLSSGLAWWLCQALLGTAWASSLHQQVPPYRLFVFNVIYGMVLVHVFEHFQDRAALSEAREKLARQLSDEARLNLLRSQLDPHMLFNTLSNLYELIDESPAQARDVLTRLVGFMRSTLSGSRASQHPLAEEFKLASDYLALMQVRMGDRLQLVLELPEALSELPVPSMLLQPLVENAIKHGLEKRKEGGLLSVSASRQLGQLVLQVRNSGAVDDGALHSHAVDGADPPGGFGLQYVRDRLLALYGEAASLDLRHLPGSDLTEVTLRMPLQRHAEAAL